MFYLYQGNRLEDLADRLSEVLFEAKADSGLFVPSVVLVNNLEMGQWLINRISIKKGICANVALALPGSYLWETAVNFCGPQSEGIVYPKDLKWLILSALLSFKDQGAEGFDELFSYLERRGGSGLFELSCQLSFLFDKYLNYRLDMLKKWLEGSDSAAQSGWQFRLWRKIASDNRAGFKADILDSFLRALSKKDKDHLKRSNLFKEPVFLFGISQLPPMHISIFSAMSLVRDVHLFFLNPSREYWADIPSYGHEKRKAKEGTSVITADEALEDDANQLLSSMGRTGADFLALLLDHLPQEGVFQQDIYDIPASSTMLSMIQRDILQCKPANPEKKRTVSCSDSSIQIHCCHSRLREVEVLHDHLLHLFDEIKDLFPHEVAVMAPDISMYFPFVQAVFSTSDLEKRIPYSFCDLAREEGQATRTLLALFDACLFDITAPKGMDLLSLPLLQRRFEMSEDDLELARYWVAKSGIRRGIDIDGRLQNSWFFGINRLIASYVAGHDKRLGHVLSFENAVDGSSAETLGRLSLFVSRLVKLKEAMRKMDGMAGPAGSLHDWRSLFSFIVSSFFPTEDPSYGEEVSRLLQRLMEIVESLERAGVERLEARVMHEIVQRELEGPRQGYSFPRGEVVFSSLVPMRNIPFRIICLLGMNDSDFPRPYTPVSYDLCARNPRIGDRHPRQEDKYLFLTTLTSARQCLYISYVGKSQRDDSSSLPSCVVTELLDYLDRGFEMEDKGAVSDHVTCCQPLQPFSRIYEKGKDEAVFTYERICFPSERQKRDEPAFWPPGFLLGEYEAVHEADEELIDVDELARFFSNPARYLLRKGLGIDFYISHLVLKGCEPQEIEKECERAFWQEVVGCAMASGDVDSKSLSAIKRRLKDLGLLPHKYLGELAWKELSTDLDAWNESFKTLKEKLPLKESHLHFQEGPFSMKGRLALDSSGSGLLIFSPSRQYVSLILETWLKHLFLCMVRGAETELKSRHLFSAPKKVLEFSGCSQKKAKRLLKRLFALYKVGQREPLPFFCNQSYKFCKMLFPKNKKPQKMHRIMAKVHDDFTWWKDPERISDPWSELILRGRKNELLSYRFMEYSLTAFQAMLDAVNRRP